jgi:hypothetical protein
VRPLIRRVREQYYEARGLQFGAEVCRSVAGAGVVVVR